MPPAFRHLAGIDVSDHHSLDALEAELETCDALVNNVGVARDALLVAQPFSDIEDVINVNLTSVLYLTRLYARARLRQRKNGTVVTISSIIGIRGYAGLVAYSASKGALNAMNRSLARELGPKGFRFNVVLPGYIDTGMSSRLSESQRSQIVRRTPLGRLATVGDIVPAVRFLLSPEASFITGQMLVIDGGITC